MKKPLNILICPLEWGLGHAGRMVPLAVKLKERGNNIFVAGGEELLCFFRIELPGAVSINFPGFKPGYSGTLPQYLVLLLKIPVLLYHIIAEHLKLKRIIREYDIDMVISDNRFGLWNKRITTVYITHMPVIPFPGVFSFLEFIGIFLHRAVMKKYSFTFIPDLPGELNLTGRLSHNVKLPENTRYIGILSRFTDFYTGSPDNRAGSDHNTVILSGPEPQREILKQKLVSAMEGRKIATVILEGRPGIMAESIKEGNFTFYSHLPAEKMKEIIKGSRGIVSRAGYSTIMELISLNFSALLIPTPGQTEQEYLARYLSEKGWFATITQKEINEDLIIPEPVSGWPVSLIEQSDQLLEQALTELSEEYQKKP